MALSVAVRQQFLAEPHIGALGVSTNADEPPLVVPIWYHYTEGDTSLWIMTGTDSMKAKLIRRHQSFSMMVQRLEPTVRYVGVRGRVVSSEDGTKDQLRQMASRYLPAEAVDAYVEWDWEEHGPQTVFHLDLEKWISLDMGTV